MDIRTTDRLSTSIVYNLFGTAIPLIVTIFTVPIYLRVIGGDRFGFLSLIWLIFGYLGLFDFGLSRAAVHRLAQLRDRSLSERADVFYTALLVSTIVGITIGIGVYLLSLLLVISIPDTNTRLLAEITGAVPLVAAMFPLAMAGSVFVGCLEAEERFLAVNVQQIAGTLIMQCFPLCAVLLLGPSIGVAVLGVAIARVVSVSCGGVMAIRSMWPAAPRIRTELLKSLFTYGGWVTVTNIAGPLLVSADQFIIGSMLGATAVALYSIPFNLAMKVLMVPWAVTRAMFPRLSSMKQSSAMELADDVSVTLASVLGLICVPAILLSKDGLVLWIGAEFAATAGPVARILLLGTWLNGLAAIPFAVLQAQGRPDVVAKFHALEVLPFLVLLFVCVGGLGVSGAALAWTLRALIDTALLYSAVGRIEKHAKAMSPMALFVIASWLFSTSCDPSAQTSVLVAVGGTGCMLVYVGATDRVARKWGADLIALGSRKSKRGLFHKRKVKPQRTSV
jgi:O-antigen/teichoic acid export membrane protein